MTKEEVNQLLALMKANYSYAFKNMSQQDKYLLLNTWTVTLQDINADVVMIAVMQLISVSKWLPTVAEIREGCKRLYAEAAYSTDTLMEWAIKEGRASPEQIERYEQEKAVKNYIADATNHLRGDRPARLTLESILSNTNFTGLGTGKSSLSMLGEAKYELPDGRVEGDDE